MSNHKFIAEYCHGFAAFRQDMLDTSWTDIEQHNGLTLSQINQAADIACSSKKTICCWAMGMCQHQKIVR